MATQPLRDFAQLTRWIREQEVGRDARIDTPFGRRLLSYADLTATGRYLRFVDAWIESVRPYYANTHTEVSSTGSLLTELRETARGVIRDAVDAGPEDQVVFCGSGATAAINKLVGLLGLRISEPLEREHGLSRHLPQRARPVVFVGPYEHHSNLLPWLECIAEVVEIRLDAEGHIDLDDLAARLRGYGKRPLKIGSFSAASNVTGVLTDVRAISRLLHRHGALAFFDYAAAGPYVPIDMHPPVTDERIDALFLSPHKFIGGPEGSGVLVAHASLFRCTTPERPGGGTVSYVAGPAREQVDYVEGLAEREEGGTPAIIGDLRAAAAFLVKNMLGARRILEHEMRIADAAVKRLARHPRIRVLGPTDVPRLAIVSFNVEELHHDLVSTLLDHLFGIQNRAGCACAGPYGHALLGIDLDTSHRFRKLIQRGLLGIKPGWVRLSLPYYASREDLEFVLGAVEFVADHGRDFVPLYRMGWNDGVWRHVEHEAKVVPGLELSADGLRGAVEVGRSPARLSELELQAERASYFEQAHRLAAELKRRWSERPPAWNPDCGDPELEQLIWFRHVQPGPAV